MKKSLKYLVRLIGLLLFAYILSIQDWHKFKNVFFTSNIIIIILSLLLFIPIIYFKSIRLRNLINLPSAISTNKIFNLYMASFFLGIITPGRLGEFSRIYYLIPVIKKKAKTISIVFIDRLSDVAFLVFWSVISFIFIFHKKYSYNPYILLALFIILLLLIIFLFKLKIVGHLINLINKVGHTDISFDIINNYFSYNKIFMLCYLTLFSWITYFLQIYIINMSLNYPLNIFDVSFITSISSLIGLIPVTFSGIGTRDAAVIYLFSIYGLSKEEALAFSIYFLFIIYFQALIALPFWLKHPVSSKELKSKLTEDISYE